jgi:hypothetical protein
MFNQQIANLQRKSPAVLIVCLAVISFMSLTSLGQVPSKPCFDFTGTGRTSFATFSISQSQGSVTWSVLSNGGDNSAHTFALGFNSSVGFIDTLTAGYYDNDNRTDAGIIRISSVGPGNLIFYIRPSTQVAGNPSALYQVQWGLAGSDLPVTGDYDGDGRTDITVVRRDSGMYVWYILRSQTNTFNAVHFGLNTDLILPGADYNGDGRDEVTVVRTDFNQPGRSSTYFAGDSSTGALVQAQDWGSSTDVYVIGDYLGDRRADFAVMRKTESGTALFDAVWYILENGGSNQIVIRQFGYGEQGNNPDIATCGDYNGDGKQDIAVYRSSNRTFYWLNSPDFNSSSGQTWGNPNGFNAPAGVLHTRSR